VGDKDGGGDVDREDRDGCWLAELLLVLQWSLEVPIITTGKPEFAVRENLCRAFFWRTANKKRSVKNCLPCVFILAHGKQIVCHVFFGWRTANFFPTHRYICYLIRRLCRALLKNARQRYMFAVRQRKTHGKVFSKNCFFYIF
jgi:hypothetical protein